jgi:endonuclease IV
MNLQAFLEKYGQRGASLLILHLGLHEGLKSEQREGLEQLADDLRAMLETEDKRVIG